MDDFCGSPFWDRSLTWDTTDPYFTHCFEETILAWVPAGFLLLFALVDVNYSLSSKRTDRVPWNIYTSIKCVIILALAAVSIAHLILIQTQDFTTNTADILSPVLRIVSYVIALCLMVLNKRRGIRTSGVQFIFWFAAFVCETIAFRTAVRKFSNDDGTKVDLVYYMRFFTFPLVTIQLILQCWADGTWGRSPGKEALLGNPCPEKNSSFFGKCLYLWYDSLAWKGYRNPLNYSDLWDLNEVDRAKTQVPLFYKHWENAQRKAKEQSQTKGTKVEANIISALFRAYGGTFAFGGLMKLIQDCLAFVSPEILKLLVAHTATREGVVPEESWKGYLYAGILLAVSLFQTLIGVQYNKRMSLIGMRVRTALSSAIYKKALLVSNVAKKESTVGEIVNLMSVDTQRFMDLTPFIHMVWASPVQIGIAIYFLYNTLGASVFAGLAVMVFLVPINGFVASKVRALQMQQMVLKDNRVKLMSELLSGMKILKLYAWEPSFQQQIQDIRDQEMKLLRKAAFLNCTTNFMFTSAPFLVSLATFATYVGISEDNNLNAEKAFVSLTLFNIIRMPLTLFPMCISLIVQATVSVNRINKYMNAEEIDPDAVSHDENEKDPISVSEGTFSWEETVTLKNINLNIKEGSLVAVVGTVGSGKSSLLNALLGDLKKHSGKVNTKGSIAYVAQGAWIQNATLRDNILFNDNFNQQKYKRVIDACSLGPDLQILSAGDKTEIGEKGINLSGGQKQRVALARAAYKESDIYLWDDPLSAVDSHVGKHIFDNLIGPNGILRKKTRVLVTHGVAYLPKVDNIIVMRDGEISEVGTFKELLMKKGAFAEFLIHHLGNTDDTDIDESLLEEVKGIVDEETLRRHSSKILQRLPSKESLTKTTVTPNQPEEKFNPQEKLIGEEKAETGSIKMSVFVDYLKAASLKMVFSALIFNVLVQAITAYSNIWLSDWSEEAQKDEEEIGKQDRDTTNLYLGVYGGLGAAQGITVLLGTITLQLGSLKSAAALHLQMLSRTMKAPMSYFDTTPLGRLVNRFAKDVDTVDILVPQNLRNFINFSLSAIATIIVISYSTPIFLAFILPCTILYFFLQRFYVATTRQLKRIESVSRSPIYSQFGETISGATTIRAFAMQDEFVEISEKKIDYNQQAYYPFVASNLWISVRLETIGSLIIFAAALFAVIGRESISPSLVGLSVSYALQTTALLNIIVRMSTDLETNIVAVERMKELTETPQEADWVVENKRPKKEWPESGVVVFDKYSARYREGLDLVVKEISCSIKPGEKVGIVGRTGAGKSSLTLALFRLVEPAGGSIKIDGQNITEIGLHDLRSKITIIPQDPVLFSGNLRINLDPFNAYSDDQVWKCLELAHLKPFVNSHPEGLLLRVAEEGQNFSVGQRQLVCLARALLRKTKILVLDEATAAVDLETDDLIQKTIREEFKYSTVITIAHRLNTIMDSNRVVVLDKGEIKEFDSPDNLLKESSSIFHSMAKDAGLV